MILLNETEVSKVVEVFKIKIGVSPFVIWEVVEDSTINVVLLIETEVFEVFVNVWIKISVSLPIIWEVVVE